MDGPAAEFKGGDGVEKLDDCSENDATLFGTEPGQDDENCGESPQEDMPKDSDSASPTTATTDLIGLIAVVVVLIGYPAAWMLSAIGVLSTAQAGENAADEDQHGDLPRDPVALLQSDDDPQYEFCMAFGIPFTPYLVLLARVILAEIGRRWWQHLTNSNNNSRDTRCCHATSLVVSAYVSYEAVVDLLSFSFLLYVFLGAFLAQTEPTSLWNSYQWFILMLSQSSVVEKCLMGMGQFLLNTGSEEPFQLFPDGYRIFVLMFTAFFVAVFTHIAPMNACFCWIPIFLYLATDRITKILNWNESSRTFLLQILVKFLFVWLSQALIIYGIVLYSGNAKVFFDVIVYDFQARSLEGWFQCYVDNLQAGRAVTIMNALAVF